MRNKNGNRVLDTERDHGTKFENDPSMVTGSLIPTCEKQWKLRVATYPKMMKRFFNTSPPTAEMGHASDLKFDL